MGQASRAPQQSGIERELGSRSGKAMPKPKQMPSGANKATSYASHRGLGGFLEPASHAAASSDDRRRPLMAQHPRMMVSVTSRHLLVALNPKRP